MSKSSLDDKQQEFVRALIEARDYLEFSADKANFSDDEDYLAVKNFMEQILKELNG